MNINAEIKEKAYSYEVQTLNDMVEEDFTTLKKHKALNEKVNSKCSTLEMIEIIKA
jgi:hypothetical protein